MKHIMIDMETLAVDSNAVIITVAMVEFDLTTGEIGRSIELHLSTLEQSLYKGVIDPSTIHWWSEQTPLAKTELLRKKGLPIVPALNKINQFIEDADFKLADMCLWGNGCTADNVWLRNLYKRHDVEFILPYWCDRDVRTLVDLAGIDPSNYKFEGVKHTALADCIHQIRYCTGGKKDAR